jgi:hypothetical protein
MKRLQRAAVLLSLIEALRKSGSWCGETNVQKAAYFLQELLEVPLEYDFILYKHGPYSFDLTDEMTGLRADSILDLKIRDPQYGPSYVPGEQSDFVTERFPKTIGNYQRQVNFIASKLGDKNVAELERIATALFVRNKKGSESDAEVRAREIRRLKPHISMDEALAAVEEVDGICEEAAAI